MQSVKNAAFAALSFLPNPAAGPRDHPQSNWWSSYRPGPNALLPNWAPYPPAPAHTLHTQQRLHDHRAPRHFSPNLPPQYSAVPDPLWCQPYQNHLRQPAQVPDSYRPAFQDRLLHPSAPGNVPINLPVTPYNCNLLPSSCNSFSSLPISFNAPHSRRLQDAQGGSVARDGHFGPASVGIILVHEATFNGDRADEALRKRHSTVTEALAIACDIARALPAGCEMIGTVLTHFSQRYPSIPCRRASKRSAVKGGTGYVGQIGVGGASLGAGGEIHGASAKTQKMKEDEVYLQCIADIKDFEAGPIGLNRIL